MTSQRDLLEMTTAELTALGMAAAMILLTKQEHEVPAAQEDFVALFSEIAVSLPDVKQMPIAEVHAVLDDVTQKWGTVLSGAVLVAQLCGLYIDHHEPGMIEGQVRELIAETLGESD